tara:strand:- start:2374 stop:2871 length:498 start_codon:yes stop_codon:yes gene_type:complete
MATGVDELDAALERLNHARDRDDHHRLLNELAPIASRYIDQIAAAFDAHDFPRFDVTWSLIGNCHDNAVALFCHALRDSDKYVRWAASEALSKCNDENAVLALISALKDRSTLVKGVAVTAMKRHKPQAAVSQLQKIANSKHMQKHSPGIVKDASTALASIRGAG